MWRARSRPRRPWQLADAPAAEVQRRVLDLALTVHPVALTYKAMYTGLVADAADPGEAVALARAVRDLALASLLVSDGLRIVPTPAALHFARLEAGR